MAKVIASNIDEVRFEIIPVERDYNSRGALAYDALINQKYKADKWDERPKTEQEALGRGEKHHNGSTVTIVDHHIYPVGDANLVFLNVARSRYGYEECLRQLLKEGKYTREDLPRVTTRGAHAGLLAVVKYKEDHYFLSQVRSKHIRGPGQIIATLFTGGIEGDLITLTEKDKDMNLIDETVRDEGLEEIGIDSKHFKYSPTYLVDEPEVSHTNISSVIQNPDRDQILHSFENLARKKISKGERRETEGLALLPLKEFFSLDNILCYFPEGEGRLRVKTFEEFAWPELKKDPLRPHAEAVLKEVVASKKNTDFLLYKAGY